MVAEIRPHAVYNKPVYLHQFKWFKPVGSRFNPLMHGRFSDPYYKVFWEGVKLMLYFFLHVGIRHPQQRAEKSRIFRYGLPNEIFSSSRL